MRDFKSPRAFVTVYLPLFQELSAGAAGEEEDDKDESSLHPSLRLRPSGHPSRDSGQCTVKKRKLRRDRVQSP